MEVTNIANLNLTDSDITEIKVTNDYEIEISLNLITDYETQASQPYVLVFRDCISATLNLNLAYSGPNSILAGVQRMGDGGIVEYEIETNTTASKIRITCRQLMLHPKSSETSKLRSSSCT